MGGVFGKSGRKKEDSRITEQDEAILKLKRQRDELKKYQKRINGVLEKDRLLARKLLQEGKKDRAKLLLRKKRYQEGLLERTDGQLDKLERLVHDLEFSQVEKQVIDGLKVGNEALKRANEMFSIEEIEAMMDESAEAAAKQKEINDLLAGRLTEQDEDDVLRELDALVAEEEREKEKEESPELPAVPTDELPAAPEKARKEKTTTTTTTTTREKVAIEA